MSVSLFSSAVSGIEAEIITVEVTVTPGTQYFIVGLPDNAVKESLYRVEGALESSGYRMPRQKIVISMAPADKRKQGSVFDLSIALSILCASGQLGDKELKDCLFTGELGLNGSLRPVKGVLSMAIEAKMAGLKRMILPSENAGEAAIVSGIEIYGVSNLSEAIQVLTGISLMKPTLHDTRKYFTDCQGKNTLDFKDVCGQQKVKRAMEIVAAGGHNAIMVGSPGSGKTMLAKRLPGILPELDLYEALETTRVHSVAGTLTCPGLVAQRPFRSPHHTASDIALVGGGQHPQPGEISLAHNGILFLDELPEFKRSVLEVLRQPLEERQISISRANFTATYPANFILIAAMNPCPCGYYLHPGRNCTCSAKMIHNYRSRISGPFLDRVDLHIQMQPVAFSELSSDHNSETSAVIRNRVMLSRAIQAKRLLYQEGMNCNAQLSPSLVREHCKLTEGDQQVFQKAMEKHKLSARAYDRILKVARTIADLDGQAAIGLSHLAEAIGYRCLDTGH
jgi:magnesium chelatase family protein